MLFTFYGSYVPIECSTNNIKIVDDDHVHDNTKNTWIWQRIISKLLSAQCVIMANVISSEAGRTCCCSSSIKVAIHQEL